MKKGVSLLEPILFVFVLLAMIGGAFYLGSRYFATIPPPPPISSQSPTQIPSEPLFSGKVTKISKDLGLFKISDIDKKNGVPESIVYYEAGIYLKGAFKDYIRILAIRPAEGPGPSLQFLLATKDYSSYLLDDPSNKTSKYPETDWDNPYLYLDKTKIEKTVSLESDHPITIEAEKPFMLMRGTIVLTEFKSTNNKDVNGNDIYLETPITTFPISNLLSSSQTQLSLFAGGTNWGTGDGYSVSEKAMLAIRKKYLSNNTYAHASDSTGLTYSYILSTEKDVLAYESKRAAQEQQNIEYKKQVILYNEKKLKEYPASPEYALFPGMRLSKSLAGLPADYYSTYDVAFPGACGGAQSTFIVNSIKDTDLEKVSSSSEYPLYVLKDVKHPLYMLAYDTKTGQGEESFKGANNGKTMPTFDAFVAKHPLLFFKDAWGRWAVMGEYELQLMGGCGKPVVYLYPEKQTTVHLSFLSPVALNTQIPTYQNGWLVSAQPNGVLTDLQPQYTDCSKIEGAKVGSEYAVSACKSNSYPYIYWTGKSVINSYPKVEGGWIVSKDELNTFMQKQLKEIGLTEKESGDMISYWVPKMSNNNAPYYEIRFIQTQDMNAFVPMNINPMPDSVLRVFLDWKALARKPATELRPQQLQKIRRNGFTLVEWGGKL